MNCTLFSTAHRGIRQCISRIGCSQWIVESVQRDMHFLITNQSSISLSNTSLVGAMKKTLLSVSIPVYNQLCGMKMKGKLDRRCKDCYFVIRQERLYVMCRTHPRHKQMAIKPYDKSKRILTVAMQSPKRPW